MGRHYISFPYILQRSRGCNIERDKAGAKKKARAEGFSYMDQIFENQPCMQKPVTTFTYDMEPFLKPCVDRYVNLAGRDAKPLKHVSTPFHGGRIARPIADEKETKGYWLQSPQEC